MDADHKVKPCFFFKSPIFLQAFWGYADHKFKPSKKTYRPSIKTIQRANFQNGFWKVCVCFFFCGEGGSVLSFLFCVVLVIVVVVVGFATDPPGNQPKKVKNDNLKEQKLVFQRFWAILARGLATAKPKTNNTQKTHFQKSFFVCLLFPFSCCSVLLLLFSYFLYVFLFCRFSPSRFSFLWMPKAFFEWQKIPQNHSLFLSSFDLFDTILLCVSFSRHWSLENHFCLFFSSYSFLLLCFSVSSVLSFSSIYWSFSWLSSSSSSHMSHLALRNVATTAAASTAAT